MTSYARFILSLMAIGEAGRSSCSRACPRCNSSVFVVSRRFADLFISIFTPIRRYRCISMNCSWEGNLREKKNDLPVPIRGEPYREKSDALEALRMRRTTALGKPQR